VAASQYTYTCCLHDICVWSGRVAMNLAWMATRKYASTRLIATASQDLVEWRASKVRVIFHAYWQSHWQAAINIKSTLASHVHTRGPQSGSLLQCLHPIQRLPEWWHCQEIQPPADSDSATTKRFLLSRKPIKFCWLLRTSDRRMMSFSSPW